jgi:hypothetical protein
MPARCASLVLPIEAGLAVPAPTDAAFAEAIFHRDLDP